MQKALLVDYERVTIVGSDSPQIDSDFYSKFIETAEGETISYLGPAEDGGFYLVSSCSALSSEFLSINYSVSTTLEELTEAMTASEIPFKYLEKNFDVDTLEGLERLNKGPLEAILFTKD